MQNKVIEAERVTITAFLSGDDKIPMVHVRGLGSRSDTLTPEEARTVADAIEEILAHIARGGAEPDLNIAPVLYEPEPVDVDEVRKALAQCNFAVGNVIAPGVEVRRTS